MTRAQQAQQYVRARQQAWHAVLTAYTREIDVRQLALKRAAMYVPRNGDVGEHAIVREAARNRIELLAYLFSGSQMHVEMHMLEHMMDETSALAFVKALVLN